MNKLFIGILLGIVSVGSYANLSDDFYILDSNRQIQENTDRLNQDMERLLEQQQLNKQNNEINDKLDIIIQNQNKR